MMLKDKVAVVYGAGGAIGGLGLLLPWQSGPQLVAFGAAGLLAAVAMLGIPIWFLLLGRHLAVAASNSASSPRAIAT